MKITNEQLSAYLDNALTPEERAVVDRALAGSAELQRELAVLRQLGHLVKKVPTPEPSEKFYRRVLEKTKPRPRAWLQWTVPLVGAAAAAMVMIFIAGEKKPAFQSMDFSRSLPQQIAPMRGAIEDRAKPLDSAGGYIEGGTSWGHVGSESQSDMDEKMKNGFVQQNQVDKLLVGRKKTAPASAISKVKGGDNLSLKEKEDVKYENEKLRRFARDEARFNGTPHSIVVPTLKKPMDGVSVAVSKKQPATSPTNKHLEPGLAEVPPSPRFLTEKSTPLRTPASAQTISILEEASLPGEWQGDSSGITDQREVIIKDSATWAKFWAEHQSMMGTPPPVPVVNFNKYMVVGIFIGERGSSGYKVQITGIEESGKEQVVSYRESTPSSGGMQLSVMTQPYHLRVVPRTNRPIRFKKN